MDFTIFHYRGYRANGAESDKDGLARYFRLGQ